jgi:hypothetical protein
VIWFKTQFNCWLYEKEGKTIQSLLQIILFASLQIFDWMLNKIFYACTLKWNVEEMCFFVEQNQRMLSSPPPKFGNKCKHSRELARISEHDACARNFTFVTILYFSSFAQPQSKCLLLFFDEMYSERWFLTLAKGGPKNILSAICHSSTTVGDVESSVEAMTF